MKRDLIIGIIGAILLHAGFVFGGQWLKPSEKTVAAAEEEVPTIELMPMPAVEPDEPEVVDSTPEEATADLSDLAPPMQTDTPSAVPSPFEQKIQPPPPPGLSRPTGVISIPAGRPGTGIAGSGMANLFDLASLDERPTPRFQSAPVYPFAMRRAGIGGQVMVGFIVDTSGDVRDAYVISSSHREFEQEAVNAVMKWKFRPGKKGGATVNARMQVPISFNPTRD
ncbi:biopolymer transporter TonB [Opitutaceae bacterium TAV5]|nr:biopolymer transporter TonB [Opitutaceae bacterium TAV5]